MSDQKTILLVEDEVFIALKERRALEKEGYRVLLAGSGESAVELVQTGQVRIDLILMDINLGEGMDGTQAAQQILLTQDIPLIFLSSHTEPEIVAKTEQITSYGYVVKDNNPSVLLASIKMAFKLHQAHKQLRESEYRYRTVVEGSSNAIGIHSEGKIVYCNPAAVKLFRAHSSEELIGMPVINFAHPDYRAVALERIKKGYESNLPIPPIEEKFFTLDGEIIDVEVSAAPILFDGKAAIQLIIRDISESKRAEERLRAMFQAIPDLIFRLNREGVFLDYKADISDLYAQSNATIIGKRNRDITPPEFANLIDEKIHTALETGKLQTFEYELFIPGRGKRDYEARMAVSGSDEVTAIVRDITGQKQAIDALASSEERYRQLVENAPDIVYRYSTQEGGSYYSSRVQQVLGYSPEFLYEHPFLWNQSIHPDDQERVNQSIREFEQGKPFDVEYRIEDAFGNWCWLRDRSIRHLSGDGEGVIIEGLATDITERKQAEFALQESEERFRVLFEGAPDAIFLADPVSGMILDANQAACQLLDRPLNQLVGINQADLHPSKAEEYSKDTFRRHVQASSETSLSSASFENMVIRLDGTQVPVEIKAHMIQLHDRQVLMGIFRDITERKEAENQIKKLLSEKELLVREIQHRVKNNLNTISILLEFQLERQEDASARTALQDAAARVHSMALLYDELLFRAEDMRSISLPTYIPKLMNNIVALFPNAESVIVKTEVDDLALKTDLLSPIGLILNELTTNSMKYAFPGRRDGVIHISVRRLSEKRARIVFEDTGVGLPDGFKIENSPGLGMQLVEMLTKQIGGSITFDGRKGTHFVIEFNLS